MQTRTLVVDDSGFRDLLSVILAEDGHDVTAVATAHDAVGAIAHRKPDLALIDCAVSAAGGIELLRRIKARGMWRNIPVIMLSESDGDDQLEQALAAGAFDYLLKPFSPAAVRARVTSALRHHRLQRELHVSKTRYQVAAQAAKCGLWEWDLSTDGFYLTTPLKELLDLYHNLPQTMNDWLELVHGDDREPMRRELKAHVADYSPEICVEHRMISTISGQRWFLSRGRTIEGDRSFSEGRRVVGAMIEITNRKFMENSLREAFRDLADTKAQLERECCEGVA